MSLLPEVERELQRAARRPLNAEEGPELPLPAEGERRRRWHSTEAALIAIFAVAAIAFAGLLVVLLRHPSPTTLVAGSHKQSVPAARGRLPRGLPGHWAPRAGSCPAAPANRYLPKGSKCLAVRHADIDGDGRPDLILLYAYHGTRNVDGVIPTAFALKVVRSRGGGLNIRVPAQEPPAIMGTRHANNRRGDEIFIHETDISSGELVGVYAFGGHRLRRAGGFWYGGDSGQQYGFSCHLGHPATIVQHQFLLEGPTVFGRWKRTDTTYVWVGATLERAFQHTTVEHGIPPRNLTQAGC